MFHRWANKHTDENMGPTCPKHLSHNVLCSMTHLFLSVEAIKEKVGWGDTAPKNMAPSSSCKCNSLKIWVGSFSNLSF